jgi:pyruvate/2-oxoglutarate/acetoin dehydrogenase E1 component
MKYIEFINSTLKQEVVKHNKLVLFGQNISAGSCLGGLTRGFKIKKDSKIINSTNSENSLCGFGFGLMMGGINSVFFMKQLDFLLLGIDHLVNTFNIIRNLDNFKSKASFTIMPIIVDNGYQGPQSSLNNFYDFCSIARIPGYTITNKLDVERIIPSELVKPGFRIICASQRLFNEELIAPEKLDYVNETNTIFQYDVGKDVTIVCFNLSFPYGFELSKRLKTKSISSSLFTVNSPIENEWSQIIDDVKRTKKLVIFEDSKSINTNMTTLFSDALSSCQLEKKIIIKRKIEEGWLNPVSDIIEINYEQIINQLL